MEIQARRYKNDQENMHVTKKDGRTMPIKRQGLAVRGALGEIKNTYTNDQAPRGIEDIKAAVGVEIDKKSIARNVNLRSYKHVQSKVDSGLSVTNVVVKPSSRPPLRREESTGRLAVRAVVSRAVAKDAQNKPNDLKENAVPKRSVLEKKADKLPALKESKEEKGSQKKAIKEPTESLQKLKLSENENKWAKKPDVCDVEEYSPELPPNIEDIDAGDNNTALLMTHYIKDIYKYLIQLEEKYLVKKDHLANQVVVTGKMRATLIDWLVEVHKQFSLVLETFHMTVGIIDRYLQLEPNVPRSRLQLVGVTAMFIASKYEEVYAPDTEDFVFITDNAYSKADVIHCEREILSKLGFRLSWPIPLNFLRRFIKAAAHGSSKNHHLAKYLVELSLVEYHMAHHRASLLAAAALCLSLHLLSDDPLAAAWTPALVHYSTYRLADILPVVRQMARIALGADRAKHSAVYKKYLDPTLARVAGLPQLKGKAIQELANAAS